MAQELTHSKTISEYLDAAGNRSKSSAGVFASRLRDFDKFNARNTDATVEGIKTGSVDAYNLLNGFIAFLKKKGTLSDKTIGYCIKTARWFLEYHDVELSDRKFRAKVKMPKGKKVRPSPLSKADVVKIIAGMPDIRLKTYTLFLAATGCRAEEALSIRLADVDFDKAVVNINGDFTKTKEDRQVFLTAETVQQMKTWLEYKYRERIDSKPTKDSRDFVFIPYNEDYRELDSRKDIEKIRRVLATAYHTLYIQFRPTVQRLGFPKITFHSFRRFVYSQIDSLGQNQFAEYQLGHSNSEYWSKPDAEKLETFRAIEPYLTYLDVRRLEASTQDLEAQLKAKDHDIIELKGQVQSQAVVTKYLIGLVRGGLTGADDNMSKEEKDKIVAGLDKILAKP